MYLRGRVFLCGLIVTGGSQFALSVPGGIDDDALQLGDCHEQLRILVSKIQENARLKGNGVMAAWKADGSVTVSFDHFRQRMRCQKGVLTVDYPDTTP